MTVSSTTGVDLMIELIVATGCALIIYEDNNRSVLTPIATGGLVLALLVLYASV